MNDFVSLSNVERQESLLRLVEKEQRVSVTQICETFSISPATARRDLEVLAKDGKVRRIHGGALALKDAPPEPPVAQRAAEQSEEKKRIGEACAGLINDGDVVFLSSGTTVLEVAVNLRNHRNLTVITNSLPVMNTLADVPEIMLVGLGGILRSSELSFIGHITELALADIRVDKVVFGIRAVDIESGLTSDYLPETQTDRAILNVGNSHTTLAIMSGEGKQALPFIRDVAFAGNDIAEVVANESDMSPEAVKEIVLGDPKAEKPELNNSLEKACEGLIVDVNETLRYYATQEKSSHVDKIYVCGGFAAVKGFVELLDKRFPAKVELWNPFEKIGCTAGQACEKILQEDGPRMAVAAGLAMRTI